MNGDEGQAMRDKRWNRLERGLEGDCSLLCFFAGGGRACRRNGGGSFNYLLFYLFYYG